MLHLLFTVSRHITVLLHTNKQLLFFKKRASSHARPEPQHSAVAHIRHPTHCFFPSLFIFRTIVCIFFPVTEQSDKNPSRKNLNSLLILCDLPHNPHPKVPSPHVQAGTRILKKAGETGSDLTFADLWAAGLCVHPCEVTHRRTGSLKCFRSVSVLECVCVCVCARRGGSEVRGRPISTLQEARTATDPDRSRYTSQLLEKWCLDDGAHRVLQLRSL